MQQSAPEAGVSRKGFNETLHIPTQYKDNTQQSFTGVNTNLKIINDGLLSTARIIGIICNKIQNIETRTKEITDIKTQIDRIEMVQNNCMLMLQGIYSLIKPTAVDTHDTNDESQPATDERRAANDEPQREVRLTNSEPQREIRLTNSEPQPASNPLDKHPMLVNDETRLLTTADITNAVTAINQVIHNVIGASNTDSDSETDINLSEDSDATHETKESLHETNSETKESIHETHEPRPNNLQEPSDTDKHVSDVDESIHSDTDEHLSDVDESIHSDVDDHPSFNNVTSNLSNAGPSTVMTSSNTVHLLSTMAQLSDASDIEIEMLSDTSEVKEPMTTATTTQESNTTPTAPTTTPTAPTTTPTAPTTTPTAPTTTPTAPTTTPTTTKKLATTPTAIPESNKIPSDESIAIPLAESDKSEHDSGSDSDQSDKPTVAKKTVRGRGAPRARVLRGGRGTRGRGKK